MANQLPYIVIFAVLFFVFLGVLTWFLDRYYRAHRCTQYPNIWCGDNWTCNTQCPSATGGTGAVAPGGEIVNGCFALTGTTGLASCLYGPNSASANVCFIPPQSGSTGPSGSTACDCDAALNNETNNCLSGCPANRNNIAQNTRCCVTGGNC